MDAPVQTSLALAQAGLDGVILDTVVSQRVGGTGRVHDWAVSRIVRDARSIYLSTEIL